MSPPFHVNFMKGIRWVQFSAQLRRLRRMYNLAGAAARDILLTLDGGFCNKTMFTAALERITLVARTRKDAALCHPANDPARPRKVYGDEKFTPEQIRQDESAPWKTETLYIGGQRREIRYKEVTNVLWQGGAKRRLLRLLVIAPTPYRLSPGMPAYYRQPGYLLVTECDHDARTILQCYFDRWQIEVNHRDEKQHIGVADAQVWNDKSVDRQPALMVAAYSFLLLASLNAFGPLRTEHYMQPPPGREGDDNALRASI